jgi:hypothetical protein
VQSRRPRVEVITEAEQSPQDQLRHRQKQYLTLMGLRVVCLIVAAVLVSLKVPLVLLWVLILTGGMVAFPWMAVMIANDRPPKEENRFTNRFRRGPASRRALNTASEDETPPQLNARQLPPSPAKVIDPDD